MAIENEAKFVPPIQSNKPINVSFGITLLDINKLVRVIQF